MANKPQGYGMTREVNDRIQGKYSDEDEAQVVSWICDRTNEPAPAKGRQAVQEWLMDGLVLHKLVESFRLDSYNYKVKPPTGIEVRQKNTRNDNVGKFLSAVTKMGVNATDLFQTIELVEGTNMNQVMICMFAVSKAARKNNCSGPFIGVKEAEENKREFDEDTQRAGRSVIGLQMGTNQVASQKGMTGYGQGRQIIHHTN